MGAGAGADVGSRGRGVWHRVVWPHAGRRGGRPGDGVVHEHPAGAHPDRRGQRGGRCSQTHGLLAGLLRHEHAPLALAQRCSAVSAPAPLFTALLNYRHSQDAIDIERIGVALGWEVVELDLQERTNYPIALNVDDLGEGFLLTAQTRQPAEPQRMCGYMRTVLENLVEALVGAGYCRPGR